MHFAGYNTFSDVPGAVSQTQCKQISCPASSAGPDSEGDCTCTTDTICIGSDSKCRTHTNGVAYFSIDCDDCSCAGTNQEPTISSIISPALNDAVIIGKHTNITYTTSGT